MLQVPGPGERSDRATLQIRSTVVAPSDTFIGQEMLPEREQALERKGRFVCSMHALMCGVSRRGSLLCTRPYRLTRLWRSLSIGTCSQLDARATAGR